MRAMRLGPLALVVLLACNARVSAEPTAPESLLTLRASHERPLERGRATIVSLSLVPGPGLRILEEGPLVLELEGSALDPGQRSLHRRDAIDPRAEAPRFEIEVRPHRDGTPSLRAKLLAWVCRGARCRPVEQQLPIPLTLAVAPARAAH